MQSLIDPPNPKKTLPPHASNLKPRFLARKRFVLKTLLLQKTTRSLALTSVEPSLIEIIKMTLEESSS